MIEDWMNRNCQNQRNLRRATVTLGRCLRITNHNVSRIVSKFPDIREFRKYRRTGRRFQRNLMILYGFCEKQFTLAFAVDMERKKLVRIQKLENPFSEVPIPCFAASGAAFYQIGGFNRNFITDFNNEFISFAMADCYRMDMKTLEWERSSSIPLPRLHSTICGGPSGEIFLIGGYSQTMITEKVNFYDPERNCWKRLPDLLLGRFKASSVYYNNRIFVSGGASEENPLEECEVFLLKSRKWKFFSPLNSPRSAHQMVLLGGTLYVMGGVDLGGALRTVEYYSIEAEGLWKFGPKMLSSRANFTATTFQEKIFIFGGEDNIENNLSVDFFDGSSWQKFCRLPPEVIPLAVLVFPMVPNIKEVACEMLLEEDSRTISDIFSDEDNDKSEVEEDPDFRELER
ncbi:hypothetical protein FO519_004473 [Halicephalobus sp. NKZ332]|nr:hypothetical protein FO519_004473 [Halicephalobus sp. NKZ332]